MEIENLKRAFQLICCCNRRISPNEDQEAKIEVDAAAVPPAMKNVGLSSVSVTLHSKVKALSFVVGVDSIDALVSDFEHSVGIACCHSSH